jgi:hypothetical protein
MYLIIITRVACQLLLVGSLFNNAFPVTRIYSVEDTELLMNWKVFSRKRSWSNYKVLFRHSPGETEENHENLNHDSRSPGPIIEPGTSRIRSRSVNRSTTMFT